MYQPFFNKYLKDISSKRVFIVAGEDDYFRINSKNHILKQLQDYPVTILNSPSLSDIQSELSSYDLFSDKKVVFIENLSAITSSSNKKFDDADIESLVKSIENTDHFIIFYNENIDKRKKVTKKLIDLGHYVECGSIAKKEFGKFLEYLNDSYKLKLKKDVLFELINYLDEKELLTISKEFQKLSLYTGDITKSNIFDLISIKNTFQIFDLMDKVVSKNASACLDIYANLLFHKQSEYQMYHFLAGQFTGMLKIKLIHNDNLNIDIPKTLNMHPFACSKLVDYSKKFSLDQLFKIQELLLNTDYKIKRGIVESKESVRYLLLNICGL